MIATEGTLEARAPWADDPWMRGRRRLIDIALRDLHVAPAPLVLDVAGGDGEISQYVSDKVHGRLVTHDRGSRECRASAAAGRSVACGDVVHLPFADSIADVAIAFEIIEHFDRAGQNALMAELYRVLKPGGVLLLSTPNRYSLESWKGLLSYVLRGVVYNARDQSHVRILSYAALRSSVQRGFRIERMLGYALTPEIAHRALPGAYRVTTNRLLIRMTHKMFVVARRRDGSRDAARVIETERARDMKQRSA